MHVTQDEAAVREAIGRARRHSPFLALQIDRFPLIAETLGKGEVGPAIECARAVGDDAPNLASGLRRERSALALALGVGDLAGALPLEAVVGELSELADRVLQRALADAFAARTPDVQPAGFVVLALGKHGSRELNYSSDVDLLFL
ncbi:MAG TPA: glutamine-synthetase adenylyltransferase, partial [Allosphingosinicella sp.]|nr:glutamine-synthetase adenylyltransferase [Allosphingosinicella sp.]